MARRAKARDRYVGWGFRSHDDGVAHRHFLNSFADDEALIARIKAKSPWLAIGGYRQTGQSLKPTTKESQPLCRDTSWHRTQPLLAPKMH